MTTNSVTNNATTNIEVSKCEVCGSECTTACGHCKKVKYCSVTCQKSNRKVHKQVCYPAELVKGGPYGGYYFRTTRDIEPNELIYAEPVGIMAPTFFVPPHLQEIGIKYIPICLACYQKCSQKCTRCQWPVCGMDCQEHPRHKLRECSILVRGDCLRQIDEPGDYITLAIIRILLLKTKDPITFDLIMKLKPSLKIKNLPEKGLTLGEKKILDFVTTDMFQNYLGFRNVTAAEIFHVRDIWKDLAVVPDPNEKLNDRLFLMLNPFFHLLARTCTINTKQFLIGNTLDKQHFRIHATTKIPSGCPIKSFPLKPHLLYGTLIRRAEIFENYGIWCNCDRCKDPTENGSYLSALKCPDHSNTDTDSYLLPMDPLNHESDWKCTNRYCKTIYKCSKIHGILKPIQKKFDELMKRANERNFESIIRRRNMDYENVDRVLIGEMMQYDEELMKTLHRNHYIRFILRQHLLYGIGHTIADGIKSPTFGELFRYREIRDEFTDRMYEIAQECAPIVQSILPGFSRYFGKMQFFVAMSQYIVVGENLMDGGSEEQTKEALNEATEASAIAMKCFSYGVSDIKDLPHDNLEYIIELENFKRDVVEVAEETKPNFSLNLADLTIS